VRGENRRAVGGADLSGVEEVLDAEGDTGEGAVGGSAPVRALAGNRLLAGAFRAQSVERSELGIHLAGTGEERVQDFDRRKRAAAIGGEQLARREPADVRDGA
jgi:hypothetical protein